MFEKALVPPSCTPNPLWRRKPTPRIDDRINDEIDDRTSALNYASQYRIDQPSGKENFLLCKAPPPLPNTLRPPCKTQPRTDLWPYGCLSAAP